MWVVPPETPLGFHIENLKKDPLTYCSSWERGRGTIMKVCHLLHQQGLLSPGEKTFNKVLGHWGERNLFLLTPPLACLSHLKMKKGQRALKIYERMSEHRETKTEISL